MEKKDALVLGILSQVSSNSTSKNRITAPKETYDAVRQKYAEAEGELEKYSFDISAIPERGFQKKLTWSHTEGLLVHDMNYSGERPHWSEVPDSFLLSALSLIPTLMANAHRYATKIGAINLSAASDAVLSGVDIPLVPINAPLVRELSMEEDTPPLPVGEEDAEEDPYEDEEDSLEDEEDSEDSSLAEIGIDSFPEMTTDLPDLDIPHLPPAAEVVETPKKRGRKKK